MQLISKFYGHSYTNVHLDLVNFTGRLKNLSTKQMNKIIYQVLLVFIPVLGFSQVTNDECQFSTHLGDIFDYCSELSEFSNIGATESSETKPFCWLSDHTHDVWFSFVPTAPAVYAQLFGAVNSSPGNINNPSIAIYAGPCNNLTELGCGSVGTGTDIVEVSVSDLIIGQVYYLRVDGRNNAQGAFHMCIESFVPVPSPESDCPDAVILCDKTGFVIENLNSVGNNPNEMTGPCIDNTGATSDEQASVWYTWTCEDSGTLEFTLSPNNPNSSEEDLDFIVYELPGGLNDCAGRIARRCMLSGESFGNTDAQNNPCFGDTGLMAGETDQTEEPGCQPGDNNFVAPLDMISGVSYGILINNFSQSGFGFSIEFGGTGTFKGPEVDFEIDAIEAFECDKTVVFNDLSMSLTDQITEWNWTFGVGADIAQASTPGPHSILYESFGNKIISLTVTTDKGCTVTKILEQFIEPCCDDISTLELEGFGNPILCEGQLGSLQVQGIEGDPAYQYAINTNADFQPSPLFGNLDAGSYEVFVIDIKGCQASTIVEIEEPDILEVDIITQDTTLDLGFSTEIEAVLNPPNANVSISWDPAEGLDCSDCLNPTSFPPGTTTYTITIEDANGCIARDQITITTEIIRPVYGPNIFTPDGDGNNDIFTLGFGPQTKSFNSLRVYDRWGNLVYEGTGLPINDFSVGWNGRFQGDFVNPAVFAWIAEVEFIDNVILEVTGSVTVAR